MRKIKNYLPGVLFIFLSSFAFAQESTLSFTAVSLTKEVPAPGRGAEQWHSDNLEDVVGNISDGTAPVMYDAYQRSFLTWDRLEPSQGGYNWANFDNSINDAISKGRKFSFSIMAMAPGYDQGPSAGGVFMAYPLYLHNLMQAEGGNNRDFVSGGLWIPNYNSANWQARQSALLNALAAHINSSSFEGKNYRDAIGVVSIGLKGCWAEWNFSGVISNATTDFPAGRYPGYGADKAIIDAYIAAFPDNPLVIPHAAYDRQQWPNVWTDPQTGWYALTASNNWGKIGYTRMNWGYPAAYSVWAEDNKFTYNGVRFDTAIMNRWKYAPITGEVIGFGATTGGTPFWDLPGQVKFYHATSIANGNFNGEQNILSDGMTLGRENLRTAWRASGYRLILEAGSISSAIGAGSSLSVSLQWKNIGVAPVYESWNVMYELRDAANKTVWSGVSGFSPKFFLPADNATIITDNFILPATISDGDYSIVLVIRDPSGYRQPLPLAIEGRDADGSYLLKNFTVKGGTATKTVTTIFTTTAPDAQLYNDQVALELGVKFRSAAAGFITGVRFYKLSGDVGTHTGELYSSSGARLAQAVFSNEGNSGWQQVLFNEPVAIAANTTYIAAYHSSGGTYAATNNYFTRDEVNEVLRGLADGTDGTNGVYAYSAAPVFPVNSHLKTNYWVDALFTTGNIPAQAVKTFPIAQIEKEENTRLTVTGKFSYQLNQNYPNPVGQYTKITYSIPVENRVELVLYDILGTRTSVLVNEVQQAGTHAYNLDVTKLPKGTYFYKMRSGIFSASRSLIIQ